MGYSEQNLYSFNRYAYGNNNPYRYVDPDGRSPLDVGFFIYDVGGVAVSLYTGVGIGSAFIDLGISAVGLVSPVPGVGLGIKAGRAAGLAAEGSTTLYRAVSKAELGDIAENGIRVISGGYETGKLFATSLDDAAKFGRNNFMLDSIPNHLIKVDVPKRVIKDSYSFTADGMNAVSIPANQLNLLNWSPLNYSPLVK